MLIHLTPLTGVLAQVDLTPDSSAIPGGPQLQQLVNGLAGFGLIASVAAVVIAAAVWALGSHSQNYNQTHMGKRGVMVGVGAAGIIGAAAALVNFFVRLGGQVS